MANSFAALLVDALENSWPAVARLNQLPPSGTWWQIWLLLAGRGFGKTRTLAEWVCGQVASGQASRIALVAATAADALRLGGRRERHSRGRAAMVPAGIRALETAPDLAERRNRDDV
jgi:phage terminase large subunit-like protein